MKPRAKTILIIDDSKTYVMYVGLLLKRMGFEIITANNGQEGLTLLRALNPDAVLLDLVMPDMDGFAVLNQIKINRDTVDTPVIISTMDGTAESRDKCLHLGCAGYLTKPVSVADLHQVMQQTLPDIGGKGREFLRAPFTRKVRTVHDGIIAGYYALSLSEGGIFLRKIDPLAEGTEVHISLPTHNQTLELQGVVIYRRELFENSSLIEPGMAIRFKDLTPDAAGQLRSFVSRLLTYDIVDEQHEEIITTGE